MNQQQTQPALTAQVSGARLPEVWGGVECTLNRVGDRYFDQMELSGHLRRPADLEQIAELGIRRLRLGLLWERHELDPSWRWADRVLPDLQRLGIAPIAGLVHHGSGPRHTGLLDAAFPEKLAGYAAAVAERYSWVDAYTPVNEPHTTARFSGMYGIWYPHRMDRHSFITALLLQMKATVLSMQAVRRVNPRAALVQTDDFGFVQSTFTLNSTAELMNERRFLPFDLLCGTVDKHHPLYQWMIDSGAAECDILWFADHPCPADIIGINYYATSDRFIDHRTWLYPEDRRSAEGNFVDVEAVRAEPLSLRGFGRIVEEVWQRYRTPVAITEVHLGGEVDQQIRWAAEAWLELEQVRKRGARCIAMTFWALLGSYYWNSLVTAENGHYEPGVFDVSSGLPVPTPLAELVHELSRGRGIPDHVFRCPAWWRDPGRFCFACEEAAELAA
jgi:beta-glucosidase/6-phospho-beta-glucosidase/beta-galactosidase